MHEYVGHISHPPSDRAHCLGLGRRGETPRQRRLQPWDGATVVGAKLEANAWPSGQRDWTSVEATHAWCTPRGFTRLAQLWQRSALCTDPIEAFGPRPFGCKGKVQSASQRASDESSKPVAGATAQEKPILRGVVVVPSHCDRLRNRCSWSSWLRGSQGPPSAGS